MRQRCKGFTLIEVIVILAVISILAAMAIPTALRIFQTTAENATNEEMDNIKKAMIGDPKKLQSSFRSDFGFLGDIGCLPTVLDRLLTIGSFTSYSFDSTKQAGAGWKGPYITGNPAEVFTKDQWGNDYTYTPAAGVCPLTATLTSNGPDGQPGGDDITVSLATSDITATVQGSVKDTAGVGLEGVPVELYYASSGTPTTLTTTTDANGAYSPAFTSVPFGQRGVRALPRLVYSPGSVVSSSGGQNILFKVVNFSTSSYTITQIRATFSGGADYDTVRFNGTTVDSSNNFTSGATVNVTSTTINASSATRPSLRIFVDSPDVQVPDIVISGQGTAATIELNSFSSDMRGIPITVTFNPSGTSSIVKFTPQ